MDGKIKLIIDSDGISFRRHAPHLNKHIKEIILGATSDTVALQELDTFLNGSEKITPIVGEDYWCG
jgi:hypothetical protein